jgi:heptosyltransferase II
MPKRIFVRGPNWIGDYVLAADFFAGLRASHPGSHITLACPAEMAGLALASGWFDEVLALSRAQRKIFTGWRFWASQVAGRGEEVAVTLVASFSSALLLWFSRIPYRVGVMEPSGRFLLSRSQVWRGRAAGKHKSQLYRDVLILLGGYAAPPRETASVVKSGQALVLAPGASIPLREWPGFVELAAQLRIVYPNRPIWVVGSPAQKNWSEKFAALADPAIEDRIGQTTLSELIELCRQAKVVIANDSGVAHLAATLAGAPTVAVFGPGDPAYVAPRGARVAVARSSDVPCSPCEKPSCHARYGYQQCLRSLGVDAVLSQIASLD